MNITNIVGIHRNLVAPSQSVNYGTATSVGDQRPRIVFRVQKIGSHLAGKLSEIRFTLGCNQAPEQVNFTGGVVAQSLLNSIAQMNVYVGQTKIIGYNDCFLYMQERERMENHPSLIYNTCAYYIGLNDKIKSHIVPSADGKEFNNGFKSFRDDTNPFFRTIDITALNGYSENNTFDFVLPLPMISDAFLVDTPLHLLDKQDILIEIFLDLRKASQLYRNAEVGFFVAENSVRLLKAEFYQVSYTEPQEILANQREITIPYTNINYAISGSGNDVRNFQFSLARQKLKKMIIHMTNINEDYATSVDSYLGRAFSDFRDSQGELPEIQVRYNDRLYFPEDCPVDTRIFQYKNDCSLFGQYVQPLGTHDVGDRLFLSELIVPNGNSIGLQLLIWGGIDGEALYKGHPLNSVILPFSLVEFNSVLANNLELIGENINDKPILVTLTPRGTGNWSESSYKLHIHCETQRMMTIRPNDVMIMNV